MPELNILMAMDVPPDPNSGAAGTEWATLAGLRNLGHRVDALWADDLRHRIRHGNLHYLLELPWSYRDAIAARCAATGYDVVHVNQPYAWLAARDHRKRGRRGVFVNRSHGWEPRITEALQPWRRQFGVPGWSGARGIAGRPLRWALEGLYPRWCVDASDGVIVSCHEDRDYILDRYGTEPGRVACIPQAAAEIFTATPAPPMDADRARRVLVVGQSSFFKAPRVTGRVFSELAAREPRLSFTWCCPESAHGELGAALSPSARDRTAFEGWQSQERLVSLYDRHGIFLFPSFAEGFGKVFLEAMARGLCVVASRVGGMRDILRDGVTGYVVESGDVEGFAGRILSLAGSPEMGPMSRAAAAEARAYSWNRVARETLAFYRSLLDRKREARHA